MMDDNQFTYYKIFTPSGALDFFARCEFNFKPEKLCEVLGLEGYTAKIISKEEYKELESLKNNEYDIRAENF